MQIRSKAKDAEVREELKRLVKRQKRFLQDMLRSNDIMTEEETDKVWKKWTTMVIICFVFGGD